MISEQQNNILNVTAIFPHVAPLLYTAISFEAWHMPAWLMAVLRKIDD